MNPSVSVIIPTYNNARFLPEAIRSVLCQTFTDFELIVVDDGSTDDTPEVVRSFPGVLRCLWKQNGGPASARNAGLSASRGELVAFLDADDQWLPHKLELQVRFLERHPDAGVVFTDRRILREEGLLGSSYREEGLHVPTGNVFDVLLSRNLVVISSVLIRRKCLEEVGVFDESLFGAEDINLFVRLSSRFNFGYIDEVLVIKRRHQANVSDMLDRMCRDEISNLEKIARLYPDATIPTRQLQARIYLRFGREYYSGQSYRSARRCFTRALRRHPLLAAAWGFLALSAVPPSLRRALIATYRRVRAAAPVMAVTGGARQ